MESLHEEWRPVVGFEGTHEVSSLGRVRSLLSNKVLKPIKHTGGYRCVSPCGKRHRTIHSLVAAAFIGPRPHGLDINHIDGDKTNNAAVNLEYVTRKENMQHARRTGLWENAGENNGRATATNEQVRKAYELVKGGMPRNEAAAAAGIATHVVSAAVLGKHWGLEPLPKRRSIRWTDEAIARAVELRRSGMTVLAASRETGIPEETIRRHYVKSISAA
jgi:hypothetical protein